METNPVTSSSDMGSITVRVVDRGGERGVLSNATVSLYQLEKGETVDEGHAWKPGNKRPEHTKQTESDGSYKFSNLTWAARYVVRYEHYVPTYDTGDGHGYASGAVTVDRPNVEVELLLPLDVTVTRSAIPDSNDAVPATVGDHLNMTIKFRDSDRMKPYVTLVPPQGADKVGEHGFTMRLRHAGHYDLPFALHYCRLPGAGDPATASAGGTSDAIYSLSSTADVAAREPLPITGNVKVSMARTETEPTADLRLIASIRASSEALSFDNYLRFMAHVFYKHDKSITLKTDQAGGQKRLLQFGDTDAYRVLRAATEAFVIVNCSVFKGDGDFGSDPVLADLAGYLKRRDLPLPGPELYLEDVDGIKMLPYLAIIRRKLPDLAVIQPASTQLGRGIDLVDGFVQEKLSNPCMIELIWSYWHEEGMLVQTMNAITRRFQNVRSPVDPDPLANMEVNPLRPLNNLIWGHIQEEPHLLTVARRNYEYDHHYGLRLEGRAVQNFRPADTRSRFIESFHHLLRLCMVFYRQDDDTTVKADAFGILNAIKELHLILSQGAHSQFGDLPSTARVEMLMQQWMLARPEFREFLPTRAMVAYPEPWMDRVDAMKTLQGWTDTSVVHFHNLAVFGEQILLALRLGSWVKEHEPNGAFNFARCFRPQVQGYLHSYFAATGLDLSIDARNPAADATMPSVLLRQRLARQTQPRIS